MWHAEPGSELGGFELIERLGRGAFAEVWSARPFDGGPLVALKILLSDDEKAFRQALREARICAQIDHRHVISVEEVFEEKGLLVQVMEYLRGGNLRELMAEADKADRWFPPNVIREIGAALAMALDHITYGVGADRSGPWRVVHRDLKPSNVLLGGNGQVKLADFGIFRAPEHVTATIGAQACTPRYAAPEVLTQSPATPESDLFSLGCILFEMVMRRQAFPGDMLPMVRFKVEEHEGEMHRPSLERVNPELADIIVRLLDKYPERRPSADQVRRALIGDRVVSDPVPLIRYMQRVRPVGQATTQKLAAGRPSADVEQLRSPDEPLETHPLQRGLQAVLGMLVLILIGSVAWLMWGPSTPSTTPGPTADEHEVVPIAAPTTDINPLPPPQRTPEQARTTPDPSTASAPAGEPTPSASTTPSEPPSEPSSPTGEAEAASTAPPDAEEATAPTEDGSEAPAEEGPEEPVAVEEPEEPAAVEEPEEPVAVEEPATPAPAGACLLVSSDTAGSSVLLNGAATALQTGASPVAIPVPAGDLQLTLRSPGGDSARWSGAIAAGQTRHVVCAFNEDDPARRCYRGVVRGGCL